jgi:hypothetical protein
MTNYDRDMSGALFRNDKKEKPSHPDYRGDITINGEKSRLIGWIKQGKNGKYLSIAASPDGDERKPAPAPEARATRSRPESRAHHWQNHSLAQLPFGQVGQDRQITETPGCVRALRQRSSKRVRVVKGKH